VGHGLLIIAASRPHSDTAHSDTAHSVEILQESDRPVAETSTCQQTTLARDSLCTTSAEFEPETPASVWSQINALERAATEIAFLVISHG